MSILDNPTAPPAAASELPAAPLDGIEIAAQGAAEHLPDVPAEASPSAAAQLRRCLAAPALDEAPASSTGFGTLAEQSAQKRGTPV